VSGVLRVLSCGPEWGRGRIGGKQIGVEIGAITDLPMPPLIAGRGVVLVLLRRWGALEEGYWHGPIGEYDLSGNMVYKGEAYLGDACSEWINPTTGEGGSRYMMNIYNYEKRPAALPCLSQIPPLRRSVYCGSPTTGETLPPGLMSRLPSR